SSYVDTCFLLFFFFQAEDGIRDGHVTGAQTCALPIFAEIDPLQIIREAFQLIYTMNLRLPTRFLLLDRAIATLGSVGIDLYPDRSEERRVGKECRSRWERHQ